MKALTKYPMMNQLILISTIFSGLAYADNPVIKDDFTADPAAIVHDGRAYLYVGLDDTAAGSEGFSMSEWGVYSSTDMENWTNHGVPLSIDDVSWSNREAWASQAIERNGTFYWYITAEQADTGEKGIGVMVADNPLGPFSDALGRPLVHSSDTQVATHPWSDIDPTVFIDSDGQAYMYWGNDVLYYVELAEDMVSLGGTIKSIPLTTEAFGPNYTEGPYVYKRNGLYYMLYAASFPENISYSTATSPHGPWTYRGVIQDPSPSSETRHAAVLEFEGESYLITHNGSLPTGSGFRRSVTVERFNYNADGSIPFVPQTSTGWTGIKSSIESYNQSGLFIRHANWDARVDTNVSPIEDQSWQLVPGLADSEGVSFQSVYIPGYYLRHANYDLELAKNDGSDLFAQDATFMAVPGLSGGSSTSFQSFNFPDRYLRHRDNLLYIESVETSADRADASFVVHGSLPGGNETTSSLQSVHSGLCVDVANVSTANGANVQQWQCNGGGNQQWTAQASNGYITLVAQHSGKCLDVSGLSSAPGANIQQWECNGVSGQQWTKEPVGDGSYRLRSRLSGLCLDILGYSTSNGGDLIQWTCHDGENQRWLDL